MGPKSNVKYPFKTKKRRYRNKRRQCEYRDWSNAEKLRRNLLEDVKEEARNGISL
jgi:hypothetical protein